MTDLQLAARARSYAKIIDDNVIGYAGSRDEIAAVITSFGRDLLGAVAQELRHQADAKDADAEKHLDIFGSEYRPSLSHCESKQAEVLRSAAARLEWQGGVAAADRAAPHGD